MRSLITAALVLAPLTGLHAQTWRHDRGLEAATAFATALVLADGQLYVTRPAEVAFFPAPARHKGTVHVFGRNESGTWLERDSLAAAASEIGDGFGMSIAVAGNVMVVGAPRDGANRGAAYVFERASAGATWQETARLALRDGAADDRFGAAVAVAAGDVLVGAPGRADGAGAVAVFRKSGRSWTEAAVLTGSSAAAGDAFGFALAGSADRVAIGAPGPVPIGGPFTQAEPRPGAAYVFGRDGLTWRETKRLAPTEAGPAALGFSVAWVGDDVLAAAPLANQMAGAIVRYRRDGAGVWGESLARLVAGEQAPGFGIALAVGPDDILVGAPLASAVFVFARDGATTPRQKLENDAAFGFFGASVAVDASVAVVGGPGVDMLEGMAFLYRKDAGGWQPDGTLVADVATLAAITGGERRCEAGKAEDFACSEVDLQAFLPLAAVGAERGVLVNDVWGWTDPETGREYALVGRTDGTAFVDVTNPSNPAYLGALPLHEGATSNIWRDMKVYANHAFIVADGAGPHGVQVFDLTRLRDVPDAPRTFTEDAHYDRINSAHNIVMNEATGFAAVVGASMGGETCGGGLHLVDVRDPKNPRFAGCFADPQTGSASTGYSHDAQCIVYHGPDEDYRGREICFGANETMLSIADVTDKTNPRAIARAAYPKVAYLHQGWVSDDHRYLFMNDEGDELAGLVPRTRTLIWDIADLDDPVILTEYLGETAATDHNLYVRGDYAFESNYVSGLRIIDISDPENPQEVGHFDTVPWGENAPGFAGSWSNYPFFRSGNIIVTSMWEGVFVLKFRRMPKPVS